MFNVFLGFCSNGGVWLRPQTPNPSIGVNLRKKTPMFRDFSSYRPILKIFRACNMSPAILDCFILPGFHDIFRKPDPEIRKK